MKKSIFLVISLLVSLTMLLAACAPATPAAPAAAANPGLQMDTAKVAAQFYNDADFAKSKELMKA
jgi:hypothetical protein